MEERVPFIRHEELVAEDSVSRKKKKNNDSRLYARMATQKWIVSPSMYRDSEEKFFSVFLWRPFILFAGHESLGMQDRGLGTKVLISYVIYTAY